MNDLWQRLKQRKLVQWALAYIAAAFALLQGIDIVAQRFAWPDSIERILIVASCIGFFFVLVLAWYHGERGTQRVTGMELLILALLLGIGGGILWRFARASPASSVKAAAVPEVAIPEKSIAVLPFENLSEDKANAYFAEGVQDEILTRLAKLGNLKVISRTSTQHFKSSPDNLPQIAQQLGVAHILEGSVQKANDQVRVNVQLIKAATDAHLWAETFDRKLTDIFVVESEIARSIADQLQAKLTGSEKILLAKKPTADPAAYELYLKGRFFWNKRTATDVRKSIDYFNEAVAKDPDYALAYAALAQAWVLLPAQGAAAPIDCIAPAEAAIRKALSLDETSADAHAALGEVRASYQFNFSGAAAEFDRAIQLNPNDATAWHWSGMNMGALGNVTREVADMRRAATLDPLSLIINTNLGRALIHARRLDEAIAQLHKTIEMDGGFAYAHRALGMALELQGKTAGAIAQYEKALSLGEDVPATALLGHLYGKIGRKDEAGKLLRQLQAESERRYVDPFWLALVYVGLDDREHALAALEQGYTGRNGDELGYLRVDAFFDPLRNDPRFEALAEKIVPAREFRGAASRSK
jgi:TolB-like protein/Tfp pilus assembly protein PilF